MFIEQPPVLFRNLYPRALWRIRQEAEKTIYITFDDGPIPEATPFILDTLKRYNIKATFFMVGDNARRYPELLERVRAEGHRIGNHTFHHFSGARHTIRKYMADTALANEYLKTDLFRPPHGWMRPTQYYAMRNKYKIVMWDVVTRDYSKHIDAPDIVRIVKKYTRPGSIITFHDSLKSIEKLRIALPECLEWFITEGYQMKIIE